MNSRTKQPIKTRGIFYGHLERIRDGNSMSEAVVMHLKKMIAASWEFGKELLLFCGMGALCGAAVGFLMYLHLGPFKNPEEAGYATGLFVRSGVELGFIVWMIYGVVLAIRRWIFGSKNRSNQPLSANRHASRERSRQS